MIFRAIFKPKWEHPDPKVRRRAIDDPGVPMEAILSAAREDSSIEVRMGAVQHLLDLAMLGELARHDVEPALAEVASQRLRALLCAPAGGQTPDIEARTSFLAACADESLARYLLQHAQPPEVRASALARVRDPAVLEQVVIDDPVASVRHAAFERVEDPEALQRIARAARSRDKQLHRLARDRLEQIQRVEARRNAALQLCTAMETLAAGALRSDAGTELRRLERQWELLGDDPAAAIAERFAKARVVATEHAAGLEVDLAERLRICHELEQLAEALAGKQDADLASTENITRSLDELQQRWDAGLDAFPVDERIAERFRSQSARLREHARLLAEDEQRTAPLRALLETGAELRQAGPAPSERAIQRLQERWERLPKPGQPDLASALQHDFAVLLRDLRKALKESLDKRRHAAEEAEALFAELETALAKGELKPALSIRDRIRHRLRLAKGVADRQRATVEKRLHKVEGRLDELRQWRHWGSGLARDRLCEELDALAQSPEPASEIAAKVRSAREAWRRMDQAEGPASGELWERFDQACTRAYQPFHEELQHQADQRKNNLAAKKDLCRELDAYERATDWSSVDWREADQKIRKANAGWRRIGPVPRREHKALQATFEEVLERLDAHLATERKKEILRRRELIAEVQRLAEQPDARGALDRVKATQQEWKPSVQGSRKEEQSLWKEYRTACDHFFSLRSEQREAANAERQKNLDRKTAICEELEGLLRSELDFAEIRKRFHSADQEWASIGPLPQRAVAVTETRFRELHERLRATEKQREQRAAEQEMAALRRRIAICERLESALEGTIDPPDIAPLLEQAQQEWEAAGPLAGDLRKPVAARFDLALQALRGEPEALQQARGRAEEHLERRLALCLEAEILAGVESPPEFAAARMEFQVSRLSSALGQHNGAGVALHPAVELERIWLLTGPASPGQRSALEERFRRALDAVAKDTEDR